MGIEVYEDQGTTNLDIKKLGLSAVKIKHDITKDGPTPVVVVPVEDVNDE